MKNKGFNDYEFMMYLENNFEGFNNYFLRYTLENILEYAHKHEHISKGQFVSFLYDIIPELDIAEIAQFADDEILTSDLILEKNEFLKNKTA